MKYFEVTVCTPYCGEELTEYYMAESEEALRESGEIEALFEDCITDFFEPDNYDIYGFDSVEDYKEYYYSETGIFINEISKEVYDEFTE